MKWLACALLLVVVAWGAKKKPSVVTGGPLASPLDHYVAEAKARSAEASAAAPGSIWSPGSRLADAARDLRASQVDDVLEILVVENASALAKGTTKTQRSSSTKNSVGALAGVTRAAGP